MHQTDKNVRTGKASRRRAAKSQVQVSDIVIPILVCIGVIALMIVVFFGKTVSSTLVGVKQKSVSQEQLTANVQTLALLEQQEPENIAKLNQEKYEAQQQLDNNAVHVEDTSHQAEIDKIMTMANPSKSDLLNWFNGCAIAGDSIVEGVAAYGFLNNSIVFGSIGGSVGRADDQIASMLAVYPKKVFLAFGLNDMNSYGSENVDRFIQNYEDVIGRIKAELPTAGIYVLGVLPVTQKAINKQPNLGNVSLYNQRLEQMCNALDVAFLNPGFILEQDTSFFDQDGMHPKGNFYYKWLTYIADMAGISG